ncbi:DUF4349 domain-containing protein [Flammeovirga yaeyamensis]|uniref:DUF4349 domain-containing protein n=1 Tax=Flammeovirga yaeyamensis TaxID=367791 RepID=A0AAX1N1W5_9BACT|nr:DUF4349 domain-containing protein [Flammeovirga yaeyamensis]MBB3698147.1 hypothetical protein [Flammeovirga yaeyamensis]NMF34496.1 DUF4349 domain-containing protein [Flammeovirga yaeyamensis]QWG01474.1 DUF4349 domain-containing protein [Flammeovirga yaeyamensis]
MRNLITTLSLLLIFSACHQKNSDGQILMDLGMMDLEMMDEDITIPTSISDNSSPLPQKDGVQKKIIKDGKIAIEVFDLEKTKSKIDVLVKNNNAYYEQEDLRNDEWTNSYELKIRIPGHQFETFLSQVEQGNGKITYKNIKARDVTDQFIDIETRLKNKRNYLKKYNDLLKKAQTVKEILEIEEKIRKLEEEIESQTGRLNYLSDLVAYSTLDLTLEKPGFTQYKTQQRDSFLNRIKYAFSNGWITFIDFIVYMFKLWPFFILLGFIIYGWRKYKAKKKKNS